MPIYEFHCPQCHVVYQFFSRRVNPEAIPDCPKNPSHKSLVRQMSGFAMGRSATSASGADDPTTGGLPDDPRMEMRMMDLMQKMESVDEHDSRAMGRIMRELTGLSGGGDPAMEEAIRRLEGGEDPERVEELVSNAWGEDALGGGSGGAGAPSYDTSLYDM
jgi:putative FmdB family regulatory protein